MALIPKLFHQTNSQAELPAQVAEHIGNLRLRNPGWKYTFYDEKERHAFIRDHYDARMLKAYERINPLYRAARADFFRYLLVFRLGGIYLDIKSGASRSFDDIVGNHAYLLSHWNNGPGGTHPGWGMHFKNFPNGEFQQWHLASVPGHVFLKAVIERVLHNIEHYSADAFGVGFEGVVSTTGPIPYTLAIGPLLASGNYHLARTNHQLGLLFNPLGVEYRKLMYGDKNPHYSDLSEPVVL